MFIMKKTPSLSVHKKNSGFTLLEIMIAIVIISFIMGIVYTTFSTISTSDKRTATSHELTVKARNLIEVLTRDISSVYSPQELPQNSQLSQNQADSGLQYAFIGYSDELESVKLDFITIDIDSNQRDDLKIMEVGYLLSQSDQEGLRLVKRVDYTPDDDITEGGNSFEMMDGLNSFKFEFMDDNGNWLSDWNSVSGTETLPKGVRVEFSLKADGMSIETFSFQVPIYIGKEF